jgi:hypothetical protein
VTLAVNTSFGTPMFNKSSSADSTGVIGKARPEAADEEVERVLFEEIGLSPARVGGSGCEGMMGSGGLMGVEGVVGCALSVC